MDAPPFVVPEKLVLKLSADESSFMLLIDLWVFLAGCMVDDDMDDVLDDDELVAIDLDDCGGFCLAIVFVITRLLSMVFMLPFVEIESSIVSCVRSSFFGSVFSFFRRIRLSFFLIKRFNSVNRMFNLN